MSHFDPDNPYSSSDAADYGADDIKQHFVELAETGSASEASALAAKLRRAGIIALANAQQYPRQRGARGSLRQHMRTFVMVFAADLDREIDLLNDELGKEGEVPDRRRRLTHRLMKQLVPCQAQKQLIRRLT